jgi:hypothetical protein
VPLSASDRWSPARSRPHAPLRLRQGPQRQEDEDPQRLRLQTHLISIRIACGAYNEGNGGRRRRGGDRDLSKHIGCGATTGRFLSRPTNPRHVGSARRRRRRSARRNTGRAGGAASAHPRRGGGLAGQGSLRVGHRGRHARAAAAGRRRDVSVGQGARRRR